MSDHAAPTITGDIRAHLALARRAVDQAEAAHDNAAPGRAEAARLAAEAAYAGAAQLTEYADPGDLDEVDQLLDALDVCLVRVEELAAAIEGGTS